MCERAVKVKKGLLGLKRGFCGKSACLRDFEEIGHFGEKIGLLVKISV